jgi:hypothetical protein
MTSRRMLLGAGLAACAAPSARGQARQPLTLFELRNYQTQPGRRDDLIAMFEAHFLDAYERAGASILGTFRNLDDPDRWVWIRAFADNPARRTALNGFYTSEAWLALREPANATIADVGDALLLRAERGDLTQQAAMAGGPSLVEVTRYFPRRQTLRAFQDRFARDLLPALAELGAGALAMLTSVDAPNSYPRLPLRTGPALVTFVRFESETAHRAYRAALAHEPRWKAMQDDLNRLLTQEPEVLRLRPTLRSFIR